MDSLINLTEPRKTYLKLSSGDDIGLVAEKIKDKSFNSDLKSELSIKSIDEKKKVNGDIILWNTPLTNLHFLKSLPISKLPRIYLFFNIIRFRI